MIMNHARDISWDRIVLMMIYWDTGIRTDNRETVILILIMGML